MPGQDVRRSDDEIAADAQTKNTATRTVDFPTRARPRRKDDGNRMVASEPNHFLLAAESGLRSSELLALRINDIDFKARTVRVDESSDQRTNGKTGPCKNAAAYRTVALHDSEGKRSMRKLKHLLTDSSNAEALVFRPQRGGPLLETTILNQGLYPALKILGLQQGGLHGFRPTGDGNLPESTLPSSGNKWDIASTA